MTIAEMFKFQHLTADGTNYVLSAGTTDVESGYVDRMGFDRIAFLVVLGDNVDTGTIEIKVEHCDTSGGTYTAVDDQDGNDVSVTVTDATNASDHKMVMIEVWGPGLKRYVHLDFNRGTANMAINAVLAILGEARNLPITQATTTAQFAAAPTKKEVYA